MAQDFVLLFAESKLVRFRELARSCSSAGLLGEFLLVDEHQQAELFLGNIHKSVPYLDYLATKFRGFGSVTAVAIAIGDAADEELRRRRSFFVRDLKQRCADKDIYFRDGTVSVPLAEGELSPSFIEPTWAFNLVGVPEDWTGESRQIGIPLTRDSAEDIAFNIAATVTGLWVWTETPPLSHGVLREHIEQPPLRLVRASTRVIPLGDLVENIAYAAMDPRNNWPVPEGCEKHPQQDQFVKATIAALTESSATDLLLRPEPKQDLPVRQRLGILDSIVLYFSHLVANLLGQPAKAWQRAKEKAVRWAEDYVTKKTFQDESKLVVRFGGRLREEDFGLDAPLRGVQISENSEIEVPPVSPTPERWRVIVRAVLGAIDGFSGVNEDLGITPPRFRGSVAVAENRSAIGPDPSGPFGGDFSESLEIDGTLKDIVIRPYDAIRYRELYKELVVEEPIAADQSVSTGESAEPISLDVVIPAEARNTIRAKMEEWHKSRSSSLLWAISTHIDGQIQVAASKLQQSIQTLKQAPSRIAEADLRQRRKIQKGKWLARLLLLLIVVAVVLPIFPALAATGVFAGGVLATALFFIPYIALFGVLAVWLANAKSQVREEFKLEQIENEEARARKYRLHYWGEIHRLEYCYSHFLDWAEILATVVWKPFGQVESPNHPTSFTPTVKALSFQFASPIFDSNALISEQIAMRTRVAGRGWLNEMFTQALDISGAMYKKRISGEGIEVDPSLDVSLGRDFVQVGDNRIYKPRYQLLEDLRSGKPQQIVAERVMEGIREAIAARELSHLVDHVSVHAFVNIDGNQEKRAVQEFLAPIIEIEELPVFERFVERGGSTAEMKVGSVYWSSSGFATEIVIDDDSCEILGSSVSSAKSGALSTSRIDVSAERFWPAELSFIQRPENRSDVNADRLEIEVTLTSDVVKKIID